MSSLSFQMDFETPAMTNTNIINEESAADVSYVLTTDDVDAEYRVEGDESLLILRAKHDFIMVPNTTELVDVSPVSLALQTSRARADPLVVDMYVFVACVILYAAIIIAAKCINESAISPRRRRRQALSRWPGTARPDDISLRSLSTRAVLTHTRRPVKRNISQLALPARLQEELVSLRLNGNHPLALPVEDLGAEGL